jgi:hypothetical protein
VALAIASANALPAAPLVCAAVNFAATLVMAFVLAPATPIVSDLTERLVYVQTHLLAWQLGWAVWIAAAVSLLWFYAWWRGRIGASFVAVALAAGGLIADVTSETMLIFYDTTTAPLAFALTGVVANGLYTACGICLTLATRLSAAERTWATVMWAAGVTLSIATLAGLYLLAAIATAVLFALFCPWCVYLAVKLR